MKLGPVAAVLLAYVPASWADDVRLDFPETVELKAVVDYVSTTLRLNILYDEGQLKKSVSLRVSEPVPRESLLNLLRVILRSRGMALVPAEQAGWWKIVTAEQMAVEGGPLQRELPPPGPQDADVVTYVLPVRHAELEVLRATLTPYLSKPGGSALVAAESRLLVLTDYAANVRRAVEIAGLLDVPSAAMTIETIPVQHQDPADLAALVTPLLAEGARLEKGAPPAVPLNLQVDRISGGLIAVGPADRIARARELVQQLDQPIERTTELYQPRYLAAARLRSLIEQMLPAAGTKMAADDPSNTLIVTARPALHVRMRELLQRFDTAPPESATPLRFYKLLNRRADDVFATIGALLMGAPGSRGGQPGGGGAGAMTGGLRSSNGLSKLNRAAALGSGNGEASSVGGVQIPPLPATPDEGQGRPEQAVTSLQGENFSLSLDEHTNSIIAIATPELHRQIETLIKDLDKRRPQVLVEVTLVSVSVDDSVNLGVELQTQDLGNPWSFELFTSFGLSTVNPTTGARRLSTQTGGTGVLLAPDEVPIIVQALATSGKTHIYSAPRILVDDNATGSIESVAESPYSSVNASTTVATTSFAGFAKAGTQLKIEPHIAEGDHLEINYNLTVSSFTGTGNGTTPPPRSSDTISSTIRVPDGHTVIVGGLLTETLADSSSHLPLLGDVPGLGLLFGTNTQSKSKVRLYAFIRPTILRNEDFEDLKYLSCSDRKAAGVADDYPPDRWQYMR